MRAPADATGPVGRSDTRLVLLRGPSASGKSSVAQGVRDRFGRGLAIVGQDYLRRIVLRERDVKGGANIGLIDRVARYALDTAGYHTVIEGIFTADRYGEMLTRLLADHRGVTRAFSELSRSANSVAHQQPCQERKASSSGHE